MSPWQRYALDVAYLQVMLNNLVQCLYYYKKQIRLQWATLSNSPQDREQLKDTTINNKYNFCIDEKHFIHLEKLLIECLFYACIGIGMAKSLYHMPWKIGLRKIRYCLNFLPQARVSCIKYCSKYIIMAKGTTWSKFITFIITSFNLLRSTFVYMLHVTTFHFSRKENLMTHQVENNYH